MDAVKHEKLPADIEDILRDAVANDILDLSSIAASVEQMNKKKLLSQHPFDIWQNKDGMYITHVIDKDGKRKIRRRRTKEELENYLAEFYAKQEEEVYLNDIFQAWSQEKLRYGEIQKQSYDRYVSDYERFFPKSHPICRKKMRNITEDDLEAFIKETIKKKDLSRKAYSGLVTLLNGIFKYAKRHGHTQISISQFMGDLELSRRVFKPVTHPKENEIFSEDEMPLIQTYLHLHADIWNLGLLLQFQTGMRIGEIAALKPEDIGKNCIRVRRTEYKFKDENGKWKVAVKDQPKTDAGCRDIILPPQARETIEQILAINPHGEYLFMNRGKRIRENTFNKRITSICEELGINHHTTHKIRKTYGTTLLDHNVNDSIVAEQMGHKDVNTTRKLYYFSTQNEKTKLAQITKAISF